MLDYNRVRARSSLGLSDLGGISHRLCDGGGHFVAGLRREYLRLPARTVESPHPLQNPESALGRLCAPSSLNATLEPIQIRPQLLIYPYQSVFFFGYQVICAATIVSLCPVLENTG